MLLEDYPDAVRWLERALQEDANSSELWYDLGRTRMMQLRFPEAETALRRSLALAPRFVKAENNLGVTYEAENREVEAEQAYKTAISSQKDLERPSEQPFLNLGKLLTNQNRFSEALPLLEAAVKIAPNDPKCHEQLARALDRSEPEQTDRAQTEMLEAIRLDPSNARLHFQLGILYRRSGKTELAKEQMQLSGKLYGSKATDPGR